MGPRLCTRPAAQWRKGAAGARLAAKTSGSGRRNRSACLKLVALSRSLHGEVCRAAVVAVEQVIETWHADRGVVDEDEQFLFAIGRNRGRYIELDYVVVRIWLVGALLSTDMSKSQHDAEPILV